MDRKIDIDMPFLAWHILQATLPSANIFALRDATPAHLDEWKVESIDGWMDGWIYRSID